MKKMLSLIGFCLAISYAHLALAESLKKANSDDLSMLLVAASGTNSAYWACYIGETKNKVYISYETAAHLGSSISKELKHVVYWVPLNEISSEQLAEFKAYRVNLEPTPKQ